MITALIPGVIANMYFSGGNQGVIIPNKVWGLNDGRYGNGVSQYDVAAQQIYSPGAVLETEWDKIFIGELNVYGIKPDGTLWYWGSDIGPSMTAGEREILVPTQHGADSWIDIYTNGNHTIGIKLDGSLWGWDAYEMTPVLISAGTWKSAIGDSYGGIAIHADGTLWAWGSGASSVWGCWDYIGSSTMTQISTDTWSLLRSSSSTVFGIQSGSDNSLFGWGSNQAFGTIGNDSINQVLTPTLIGTFIGVPVHVSTSADNAAYGHTLAIDSLGNLYAWGSNAYGQFGNGTNDFSMVPVLIGTDKWSHVEAGDGFSIGIKTDGTLWFWGWGAVDQEIGAGATSTLLPDNVMPGSTFVSVSAETSCAAAIMSGVSAPYSFTEPNWAGEFIY